MIESFIYSRLSSDATLATLVGDRIYPVLAAQDAALPHISYRRISGESFPDLSGDTITRADVVVSVWAERFDTLQEILEAVQACLHCYREDPVQGVFLSDTSSEEEQEGYHAVQTYTVWV